MAEIRIDINDKEESQEVQFKNFKEGNSMKYVDGKKKKKKKKKEKKKRRRKSLRKVSLFYNDMSEMVGHRIYGD